VLIKNALVLLAITVPVHLHPSIVYFYREWVPQHDTIIIGKHRCGWRPRTLHYYHMIFVDEFDTLLDDSSRMILLGKHVYMSSVKLRPTTIWFF
jgi:hypothetical protein